MRLHFILKRKYQIYKNLTIMVNHRNATNFCAELLCVKKATWAFTAVLSMANFKEKTFQDKNLICFLVFFKISVLESPLIPLTVVLSKRMCNSISFCNPLKLFWRVATYSRRTQYRRMVQISTPW